MAPRVNKWSSLDDAHEEQVTVIVVATNERSQFILLYNNSAT